jgi:hypothetical protein
MVTAECQNARRPVPTREIEEAARKSYEELTDESAAACRTVHPTRSVIVRYPGESVLVFARIADIEPDWVRLGRIRDRHPEICQEWLRRVSPVPLSSIHDAHEFLMALFKPGEIVAVVSREMQTRPIFWCHDTDREKFIQAASVGAFGNGTWFLSNPISGLPGRAKDGYPSWYSEDTITSFRHVVLESDRTSGPEQEAAWLAWIATQRLFPVLAVTSSGGKSLHALGAFTADCAPSWRAAMYELRPRLAAYAVDPGSLSPRRLTRLPFFLRGSTGRMQELLYLDPAAKAGEGILQKAAKHK